MSKEGQYICTKIGGFRLAFDVTCVSEIIKPDTSPYRIEHSDGETATINYSGQKIPVIYLSDIIHGDRERYITSYRALITSWQGRRAAIVVDSADEIIRIAAGDVKSPTEIVADIDIAPLEGMINIDEDKIHIVSVEKIFNLARVT